MDYTSKTLINRLDLTSIAINYVYSEIFTVNGLVYVIFGCHPQYQNGQISIYLLNNNNVELIQNVSFEFCLGKITDPNDMHINPLHEVHAAFPLFGANQPFAMERLNDFDAIRIKAIPFNF